MEKRLIFIFLVFISFGIKAQSKYTRVDYIEQYRDVAIKEMKRSGVPASITLAQGILESDNGNSTLAVKANNHFGIKCHNGWNGKSFYHDDDKPNECFRKYKNASESFHDHSNFLTEHQRYDFLFEFKTNDYKSWARGLKKAGYATNSQYDNLLIKIIEESELYKYDDKKFIQKDGEIQRGSEVVSVENGDENTINPFGNDVKTYNRINYVIVKEGDTFESIALKHDLRTWQLYKYNELPKDANLMIGRRMYIQPKRRKAEVGNKYHTIAPGENMYIISQMYGMKIKNLYKLNNLEYSRDPDIGYTLSLRKRKK